MRAPPARYPPVKRQFLLRSANLPKFSVAGLHPHSWRAVNCIQQRSREGNAKMRGFGAYSKHLAAAARNDRQAVVCVVHQTGLRQQRHFGRDSSEIVPRSLCSEGLPQQPEKKAAGEDPQKIIAKTDLQAQTLHVTAQRAREAAAAATLPSHFSECDCGASLVVQAGFCAPTPPRCAKNAKQRRKKNLPTEAWTLWPACTARSDSRRSAMAAISCK